MKQSTKTGLLLILPLLVAAFIVISYARIDSAARQNGGKFCFIQPQLRGLLSMATEGIDAGRPEDVSGNCMPEFSLDNRFLAFFQYLQQIPIIVLLFVATLMPLLFDAFRARTARISLGLLSALIAILFVYAFYATR